MAVGSFSGVPRKEKNTPLVLRHKARTSNGPDCLPAPHRPRQVTPSYPGRAACCIADLLIFFTHRRQQLAEGDACIAQHFTEG